MIGKDWLDLETREDLKRDAVDTAATIKYIIHTKAETARDFDVYDEQEECNVIRDVLGETEEVKMYVKPPKIFHRNFINL